MFVPGKPSQPSVMVVGKARCQLFSVSWEVGSLQKGKLTNGKLTKCQDEKWQVDQMAS